MEQVDFRAATLHVRRTKNGTPATLTGRELRALRRHQREAASGAFVFVSERGAPLSAPGFSRMVERAGQEAKLGIKVHAHMLRHACGYALGNAGHDTRALQAYLGHANIQRPREGSRASGGTNPREPRASQSALRASTVVRCEEELCERASVTECSSELGPRSFPRSGPSSIRPPARLTTLRLQLEDVKVGLSLQSRALLSVAWPADADN